MFRGAVLILAALPAFFASAPSVAQELVADLSDHLVAITTGFSGTDVLLFGATDGIGEVVVVVRGPERREIVRRKSRVGGIWMNTDEMTFDGVPAFYMVGASRPLHEVADAAMLARHDIGADNLRLRPRNAEDEDPREIATFRTALLDNKQRDGLYESATVVVTFLGQRLFRTDMHFPANVPTGTYLVDIYLFKHGGVVSAQTTPLLIGKVGVGAEVYDFAHRHGALYGMVAVLVAALAGWLASTLFRKA